jgi:hypothetical protein
MWRNRKETEKDSKIKNTFRNTNQRGGFSG